MFRGSIPRQVSFGLHKLKPWNQGNLTNRPREHMWSGCSDNYEDGYVNITSANEVECLEWYMQKYRVENDTKLDWVLKGKSKKRRRRKKKKRRNPVEF